MNRETMYEAREAYLSQLERLLSENLPEGRDELEYMREQLAHLDVAGTRR